MMLLMTRKHEVEVMIYNLMVNNDWQNNVV